MWVLKNRNKRKPYAGNIWYFRGMGGTPHSDYVKNNGILKICTVKERNCVYSQNQYLEMIWPLGKEMMKY